MEMRSIILLVSGILILSVSQLVECRSITSSGLENEVPAEAEDIYARDWVKIVKAPQPKIVQSLDSVLELECLIMGSPAPMVQWISGSNPQIPRIEHFETNPNQKSPPVVRVRSVLRIDHVLPNERVYTCIGRSGGKFVMSSTTVYPSSDQLIKSQNLSDLLQITDIALPGVKNARIVYNHEFVLNIIGSNVYLPCEATGRPQPEIYWMNNDGIITGRDPRFKVLPDGKLLISNLKWSDMGVYKCIARNPSGKDVTETFVYPALKED